MLKTIIKRGSYHDSVALMLLSNTISAMEGVNKVSIMMATPANKDVLRQSGLGSEELLAAGPNDMAIAMDIDAESLAESVLAKVEEHLQDQAVTRSASPQETQVTSWDQALAALPKANIAVLSIAGSYAASEAERALDAGLHVFLFSDNVDKQSEVYLKQKAHSKGLLVMGPDCGTAIIQGAPIAFTNAVRAGSIGIVGASGTGIQEVSCIIDRLGEGVTNALGTGGRDLQAEVGGITTLDAITALEDDENTKVIVVISKPPAAEVRKRIIARLACSQKPVVALFLGEKPKCYSESFYQAYTLDEAARIAVALVRNDSVKPDDFTPVLLTSPELRSDTTIKAYYAGGTLAYEAAMLIKSTLQISELQDKTEGYVLNHQGNLVIDLGDDLYTQGMPHPMIAPERRIEFLCSAMDDLSTEVILFDVVLGYGSHGDMVGALMPTIKQLYSRAEAEGRSLKLVTSICGTSADPQDYASQRAALLDAGVLVCDTNKQAVITALAILGYSYQDPAREVLEISESDFSGSDNSANVSLKVPAKIKALISSKPEVINIGLASFTDAYRRSNVPFVQYNWQPPAGGNLDLIAALAYLRNHGEGKTVVEANQKVISKIMAACPILRDVVLAKTVLPELNYNKTLLHAGPPILWENMTNPMQGSCIGAALFEGWAQTESEAREQLAAGEVRFLTCHSVNAVGPMGGITSANMPVFVVENTTDANRAYCTMNEGIGKVLRFGAYSDDVIQRLIWMRDVLGPVLGKALAQLEDGLAIAPIIAKAIAMGDEFHQRNIAASLAFLKEVSPLICELDIPEKDRYDVIRFLADTDQFFLNIMMATAKAVMDGARLVTEGSVVTAMCRNGENFGIRISGMGDEWFTAPVNTPQGLYFTGYTGEDASPDMGDSAITETFGVGGMAMIAAPAVTRFVGAGGFADALRTSEEMQGICIARNPNFTIPTWDFQGICLGIDACKVVESGITPVINTGIAHRLAGFGQIGAGTVHPPLKCFENAITAYACKLGFVH